MVDSVGREKGGQPTDPMAAVADGFSSEPIATDPLETLAASSQSSTLELEKREYDEKEEQSIFQGGTLETTRTMTNATTLSTIPSESQPVVDKKKKPWYKRLNPLKRSIKPPVPKERTVSREYNAGFLSLLTFQWMAPLMSLGYQRTLETNDVWLVNPDRRVELLSERMRASFRKRMDRGDRYPLLFALHETMRFEIWLGGLCSFVSSIFQVITPFALRYLISFANKAYIAQATHRPAPRIADGIGLVIGITLMQLIQSLGTNHFIYRGQMVGAQCRGVLIDIIFEKAMKISGRAKAGGKEIESPKSTAPAETPEETRHRKQKFATRLLNRKQFPQGGQAVGTNNGAGILGDGHGW